MSVSRTQRRQQHRKVEDLRQQIKKLPEPEWMEPMDVPAVPRADPVLAGPRQPPPGGWPDDEGWDVEAQHYQGMSGEDPQC